MKKSLFLQVALFLILFISYNLQAQAPDDFFTGQWKVVLYGTPEGDPEMIITLERKEGNLAGTIGAEGEGEIEITSIEEKDTSITIYFYAAGYDVYLNLEKTDDGKLEGTLMDMFTAKGERIESE